MYFLSDARCRITEDRSPQTYSTHPKYETHLFSQLDCPHWAHFTDFWDTDLLICPVFCLIHSKFKLCLMPKCEELTGFSVRRPPSTQQQRFIRYVQSSHKKTSLLLCLVFFSVWTVNCVVLFLLFVLCLLMNLSVVRYFALSSPTII